MRVHTEKGFTLIEVIMASIILVIGMGIIGSIITSITKKNFFSFRQTQAVVLAQNKIEELVNEGYNSPDMDSGTYVNPLNPVSETGDSSGVFNQFWTIIDLMPIPRSKQIISTIQWEGTDGELKTVELTATCIDESN
ncbi:prepilin-type N-terminal cleavage/methylation domain-containing protein [Candidatus Latescibacterota bacterium]